MTSSLRENILSNARIVLDGEVTTGSLRIVDGVIADIATNSALPNAEDMQGDHLVPGLVELHTDHMEGHFAPRIGVRWNPAAAVLAHDAQLATSGVTTVFDAIRVGMEDHAEVGLEDMTLLADAVREANAARRLRAQHFIHLRCEVSTADCLPGFERLAGRKEVLLASMMDHAPGQRQFTDLEAFRAFHLSRTSKSEAAFDAFCAERIAESEANAEPNRAAIAAAAERYAITLASHDDATPDHVRESLGYGVRIAEFPTTIEAARTAHEAGMGVMMGAPNLVRGGSHSGNVAARDLAEAGLLDILSSDYIPFSLIYAVFQIARFADGISLPQAVSWVTSAPAKAVGLTDRGRIAPGQRADLVRVRADEDVPVVRTVWREGQRVA
ncbi:alpha-D-ribose 1-methylphosphonate 5-triphosphate diphosphatase [Pararhizobium mangrovi]|uniref:Alpha-D-ribose 1-methylphosphonate 5-triphosphate diphosphatase n=1 Tax=Pararhizobium mangrovi TaxID=2590452 RepID=A0A506TZJ6_9HYPH|nr:alpha-D-ribose 1-methylphosphonate 5-triphosphate diphosphatase [Pararhizobium mangrovi]TPW26618.1 alpha-D-ribose 1-methylphosphonate 5-triphosphate diphosphatase [Pararhizobium mangrovi]